MSSRGGRKTCYLIWWNIFELSMRSLHDVNLVAANKTHHLFWSVGVLAVSVFVCTSGGHITQNLKRANNCECVGVKYEKNALLLIMQCKLHFNATWECYLWTVIYNNGPLQLQLSTTVTHARIGCFFILRPQEAVKKWITVWCTTMRRRLCCTNNVL